MSTIMAANDPRHGTEAGHEQHIRDGHNPCHPCAQAKLKAARRRHKRKAQGFVYTMPAGRAYERVQRWLRMSATQEDIARHTGLESSVVSRVANGSPEQIIYPRTWRAIMSAPAVPLTNIGATRRLRALAALGYSVPVLARETGLHRDTIEDIRASNGRSMMAARVREAIAETYARLEMHLPTGDTQQERAGITRTRNMATHNGWPPPLTWDHIDDATEQPHGWQRTEPRGGGWSTPDRHAELDDLIDSGAWLSEACRVLDVTAESLEKWAERNGRRQDFVRLRDRERGAA